MGGLVGLRYEGVEAALRMSGMSVTPQLFEGLQVMEHAALVELRHQEKPRQTR